MSHAAFRVGLAVLLLVPAHTGWAGLTLTTDHRSLAFGLMELGESKELAQFGTYHNEISCSSANGRTWYLKVQVLQPLSSGVETIPPERLEWQAETPDGVGVLSHPNASLPMSLMPQLVYLSGPSEAAGSAIRIRLKYRLTIPDDQVAGAYQTTVRFTLNEVL